MTADADPGDLESLLRQIKSQAAVEKVRISRHALEEMVEEGITLNEVLEAVANAEIIEYYPQHRRGPCCLLNGCTVQGRHLHLVCTTALPVLLLITAYEPRPPKWVSPTRRRGMA
ncbi:MAG: DUF4258 domain-containing protein [Acidobacteria bacterium]|nr:DUF4258 domain-containing protein [Acidobacteriota bacterium]